jgi:hypothetical protein
MNIQLFLLCNLLLYFLYVEKSVGNVIWRVNALGKKYISFGGAFAILLAPFKYKEYWNNTTIISLNFFYWIIVSLILYMCCQIPN